MAFENVDVTLARTHIENCLASLNETEITTIKNELTDSIWKSNSKTILKDAMDTLTLKKYADLRKKLNDYKIALGYIEDYQECQKSISDLNANLDVYENKIKKEKNNDKSNISTINEYENKIDRINNSVSENRGRMRELENLINNLM